MIRSIYLKVLDQEIRSLEMKIRIAEIRLREAKTRKDFLSPRDYDAHVNNAQQSLDELSSSLAKLLHRRKSIIHE